MADWNKKKVLAELERWEYMVAGDNASCEECPDDETGEGFFSWQRCELCGGLPGVRYPAHAAPKGNKSELYHFEICQDCLMYIANGEEPPE